MQVLAEPIDALVIFHREEKPVPYKFRYTDKTGASYEVRIDKILSTEVCKPAGQNTYVYECQSEIQGVWKRYQLKYILPEAKWMLYKI